ncbi:hypothetical protein L596_027053 [Steinernema carpocapsae]|uniref:Phosphatidylinositol transfer protein N-terminal domain-containing protein n=2 Tax=Steinernema carpocapsae TaxID=34508 RepID=A0A4U5M370_STECR|nr:hypothetical protein L596_027053 [Steinernema carpocapsae]
MLIKEYRVICPLEVDEYQRGQLYAVAEASKAETGGGEGVEVLKQEPFTSDEVKPGETLSGTYTHKIYRLKNKMPWIVKKMFPDSAMVLEEECWNAYPYIKTVVTNPGYMKKDFYVIIESMHLADSGDTLNALELPKKLLKQREVVHLDIWEDCYLKKQDITPETDPRRFRSSKTGRGPLKEGWYNDSEPVMCCYKVIQAHFKWMGLQNRVEKLIHKQYPRLFVKFNREVFCWIDKWYVMSMEDIEKYEEETAAQLKKQLNRGQIRGMVATEDNEKSKYGPNLCFLESPASSDQMETSANALDDFRNDSTKILQELAFILNVKEHLGADEMTSQEQRATEFEMEYLKLIGIVTPEADNYGQPKRGLAEG